MAATYIIPEKRYVGAIDAIIKARAVLEMALPQLDAPGADEDAVTGLYVVRDLVRTALQEIFRSETAARP